MSQRRFDVGKVFAACQICPLVRIVLQIVELFAIISEANLTPVAIHDSILAWVHVRQEDVAILG